MTDKETKAALGRIRERTHWTIGWLWCGFVTLVALTQIVRGWNTWGSYARFMAGLLIAGLIMVPVTVIVSVKK